MLSLLLLPAVLAYESPDQEIVLQDETDLFEAVEYDSGWIPNGSPVAVAFRINTSGGVYTEMEGNSWLYWPPALTQGFTPTPESGWFALDTVLTASVDMQIDITGYYDEFSLASTGTGFAADATFTPFLLPGGEVQRVDAVAEGAAQELFNLPYSIISGVDIYLTTDLRPDASASLSGERFTMGDETIEVDGGTANFQVPSDGSLDFDAIYTGIYDGVLSLTLIPSFGVCVSIFGCYDVASFELPIDLVNTSFAKDFAPVPVSHPLPLLVLPEVTVIEFGDVEIGQIATYNLPLSSLGDLVVEGDAGIMGAGEFSVFPPVLYVPPQGEDGIVITFAPTIEGTQESELVLSTSDPRYTDLRITLIGNGVEEHIKTIPAEVGCNCASAPSSSLAAWPALLGLLALLRRRS